MINHLNGILDSKEADFVIVEVNGVGYKVQVPVSTAEKLPSVGKGLKLYITESFAMYGGGSALYGFLTREEKDMFLLLRDEVPGAGAKKALDYLDKISRSLPDFAKAVMNKDINSLMANSGFTRKTAEKISAALKDKIDRFYISGKTELRPSVENLSKIESIAGLVALGYRENKSREAVESVLSGEENGMSVQEIIKKSLRYLK